MGQLVLVLGGVRSGKSGFAEKLAAAEPPVTYVATALAGDAEMTDRIARHRSRRQQMTPPWRTIEEPWNLAALFDKGSPHGSAAAGCLLVECVPLWLTNLMLGLPGKAALADQAIQDEVRAFADAAGAAPGKCIVVSSEVGYGMIPANALARRFADVLGEANQCLAAAASEVHACLAGIPLRLK